MNGIVFLLPSILTKSSIGMKRAGGIVKTSGLMTERPAVGTSSRIVTTIFTILIEFWRNLLFEYIDSERLMAHKRLLQ